MQETLSGNDRKTAKDGAIKKAKKNVNCRNKRVGDNSSILEYDAFSMGKSPSALFLHGVSSPKRANNF